MISVKNRPGKIYLVLLLAACLMFVDCRKESAGCVSLIFDRHTVPPRGILEDLKQELKKIDYVHKAEILGLPESIIDIIYDKKKMEAYGLVEEEVSRQIKKQISEQDNIKDLQNIRIETKQGHLISLAQIARFEQRKAPHELFYEGRQVYVIKIEYNEEMHGQLINKLEKFRELSWMEFIIEFNCGDYSE